MRHDFRVTINFDGSKMTLQVDQDAEVGTPVRIDGIELFCRADPAGFRYSIGREIVKPPMNTAEDAQKLTHTDLGHGRYL